MLRRPAMSELQFALSVFRDGLEDGGCLICGAVARVEQRSLFAFLYEGMTAPDVLERFTEGGGFCPRHFWWVMNLGINPWSVGPVEIATLCKYVIPRAVDELQRSREKGDQAGLLSRARRAIKRTTAFPGKMCVFCIERLDREQSLVALLEMVVEREIFAQAVTTHGLCLHHAFRALNSWKCPDRIEWLSAIIRARSDRLVLDLRAFLRKYDDQFRDEPFGREIDAVHRAVQFLVGPDPARSEPIGGNRPEAGARGNEISGAE